MINKKKRSKHLVGHFPFLVHFIIKLILKSNYIHFQFSISHIRSIDDDDNDDDDDDDDGDNDGDNDDNELEFFIISTIIGN